MSLKLFNLAIDSSKNLLSKDGEVYYYGVFCGHTEAENYYSSFLKNIEWRNDEANIFGKKIITKRKVAWYGDQAFEYHYSNAKKVALPWTKDLLALKAIIEQESNETFNSCLLNLYHNGSEGMAWHSDGEKDLKKNGAIASVSFGAERKFCFKHKISKEKIDIQLEHGSLLVMKGSTQSNWLHRLPPTKRIFEPRINLTFRTIENN